MKHRLSVFDNNNLRTFVMHPKLHRYGIRNIAVVQQIEEKKIRLSGNSGEVFLELRKHHFADDAARAMLKDDLRRGVRLGNRVI